MRGFETGREKVKKICDILRKETLEPAREEADKLVVTAKAQAEEIVAQAKAQAEVIKAEALAEREHEKNVLQSSLEQACKQALEMLRQDIETKLLDQELAQQLSQPLQQPQVLADLIAAVIKAIDKEGLNASLSAFVPAVVPARSVNELLGKAFLDRLQEKSVLIGSVTGGVEVVLKEGKITIDLSDKALRDLVAYYIRKDFRKFILGK